MVHLTSSSLSSLLLLLSLFQLCLGCEWGTQIADGMSVIREFQISHCAKITFFFSSLVLFSAFPSPIFILIRISRPSSSVRVCVCALWWTHIPCLLFRWLSISASAPYFRQYHAIKVLIMYAYLNFPFARSSSIYSFPPSSTSSFAFCFFSVYLGASFASSRFLLFSFFSIFTFCISFQFNIKLIPIVFVPCVCVCVLCFWFDLQLQAKYEK